MFSHEDQMNLGQFIQALKDLEVEPDTEIFFDFCHCSPVDLHSYRGIYSHCNLNYTHPHSKEYKTVSVAELIETLERQLGTIMGGYKGGEYEIREDCPMWVSGWGYASGSAIVGVRSFGYKVIIDTAYIEW